MEDRIEYKVYCFSTDVNNTINTMDKQTLKDLYPELYHLRFEVPIIDEISREVRARRDAEQVPFSP